MRTFFKGSLLCVPALAAIAMFSGCDKDREYRGDRYEQPRTPPTYVNSPGNPSSATPSYPVVEDKEKGIKYAVLQQGAKVPGEFNGWQAVNPEFFTKLSGITVTAPEPITNPQVAGSYLVPKIIASDEYPDRKVTVISGNYLITKEVHGWVAMSPETLQKLIQGFMTRK